MSECERLQEALTHLERQRAILGDAVVEAAIAALRRQMAELAAEVQPPEQQRKQATVLFADLSGFTALAETMDAEELTDLLNALWQALDSAIVAHGGSIDKHVGDAVMALWGTEQAREDDPARAVRAGLAMQRALQAFCQERGVSLSMRIGIHTGPVLLGRVGTTGEFTAMGDTVNLANRLEQAAPPGGVLISHNTCRQVQGLFEVRTLPPIQVKGKREPVQTYVVLESRPRAFRMATRGVEGIVTRMVGREAELGFLQDAFRQAVETASPRLVTVLGEAGVGKSRLLSEFEQWLEGQGEPIRQYRSRSTAEMQATPYSLWRDLFAYRFDIHESDTASTVISKFRSGMAEHLAADQSDLVGHLVGFDFSASRAVSNLQGTPSFRNLALSYLTRYLRAVAEEATAIFLEDVHWADAASLDLVEHLAGELYPARLLIVCLARPEFLERRPQWAAGTATHDRLVLKPLSPEDSRALVAQVLQRAAPIPERLSDLIVSAAEGNPFYLEEIIKMLIEEGVIERGAERWQVNLEQLGQFHVPPTLTALLQARLEHLPGEEKGVLQRAAVVGRVFWDMAVAALESEGRTAEDLDEIRTALGRLQEREMIYRQERSTFADAAEYVFKHALLRDVAYETVLLKSRRTYHRQVAGWLEARLGGRLAEYGSLIAGHYELAGEKGKAAGYLHRVGEELHKVGAYREAAQALERALGLWPEDDPAGRAEALVALGKTCNALSDYAAASAHLEAGLKLARAGRKEGVIGKALAGLAHVALDRGDYAAAQDWAQQALEQGGRTGDRRLEAQARHCIGLSAHDQGEYAKAERYLRQSLALRRVLGDRLGVATCLSGLGRLAHSRGDFAAATEFLKESLAIRQELGDRWGTAISLNNLGIMSTEQQDYAQARQYHEKSLALSREIGYRQGEANALGNLGMAAMRQGDYVAAMRYFHESLALARSLASRWTAASALNNLGVAAAACGDDAGAREYFGQALVEAREIEAAPLALEILAGLAGVYARAGRHREAATLLGMILHHPASHEEAKRTAEPVLELLRAHLSADDLGAAIEQGRNLELNAAIEQIGSGE